MNKVSIIIPIYNAEKYLDKCLSAVFNQTYKDLEVIMIDDGSTDGSAMICNKFVSIDARFKYYFQNNSGPSEARNNGIKESNGKYIMFCDADDYMDIVMIEEMMNCMLDSDSDLIICDFYSERNQSKMGFPWIQNKVFLEDEITYDLLPLFIGNLSDNDQSIPIWGSVVRSLFKSEIIRSNSIQFNKRLTFAEDLIFTLSYLNVSTKVMIYPKALYYYTYNKESLMNSYNTYNPHMLEIRIEIIMFMKQLVKNKNINGINERIFCTARKYYIEAIGNEVRNKKATLLEIVRRVKKIMNRNEIKEAFERHDAKGKQYLIYLLVKMKLSLLICLILNWRICVYEKSANRHLLS